jgi:hypothetical protein
LNVICIMIVDDDDDAAAITMHEKSAYNQGVVVMD